MDLAALKTSLEKRGYAVSCFSCARMACDYLDKRVDGTTVGFGGSVTLEQMGLYERLSTHNTVAWHQRLEGKGDTRPARREAHAAKVYFSSANALAESGEIVNIDRTCNRVAATLYGHEKVFLVIGRNKIVPDYESALYRARNVAAPLNARRLGAKTPCAVKGDRCYDCSSPDRLCRCLTVLWECPYGADVEIVLIDEDLGY